MQCQNSLGADQSGNVKRFGIDLEQWEGKSKSSLMLW